MLLSLWLAFGAPVTEGFCRANRAVISATQKWQPGDYKVKPVTTEFQPSMLKMLGKRSFIRIPASLARSVIADPSLLASRYYYVARLGWIGHGEPGTAPDNIGIDVDTDGVAFVTTFVLVSSKEHGMTEFAGLVASPTPLRRVVAVCMGAE